MDVSAEKLTAAVDGMEIVVDLTSRDAPPGAWTTAKIRYPGGFASALMARLEGTALYAGDAACAADVETEEEGWHECGKPSRFVVTRSDGDPSYGSKGGSEETCEQHLAETVSGMIDGDENVRAIVTIRWDKHEVATAAGEGNGNDH